MLLLDSVHERMIGLVMVIGVNMMMSGTRRVVMMMMMLWMTDVINAINIRVMMCLNLMLW